MSLLAYATCDPETAEHRLRRIVAKWTGPDLPWEIQIAHGQPTVREILVRGKAVGFDLREPAFDWPIEKLKEMVFARLNAIAGEKR